MPNTFKNNELTDLPSVFSAPRFATYLQATGSDRDKALALYRWNLQLSAAFFVPLQVCEVGVRNGVVEAVASVHGQNWHLAHGFQRSLISSGPYNQRAELIREAGRQPTAGKVVAELKFVFWQHMFTARHDSRIWNSHLLTFFPNVPAGKANYENRGDIYDKLEKVRKLRNRIAHHEPIFKNNNLDDYMAIRELILYRSDVAAGWVDRIQTVTDLIRDKP